jgi:hypothetical protein
MPKITKTQSQLENPDAEIEESQTGTFFVVDISKKPGNRIDF